MACQNKSEEVIYTDAPQEPIDFNGYPIKLTEKAAKHVLSVMEMEGSEFPYLRIGVRGGGCSGFTYMLDFAKSPTEYDLESEQYGVKVLIDEFSAQHLAGTVVDYVNDLMQSGFKFENPKATRHCGCGQSFG